MHLCPQGPWLSCRDATSSMTNTWSPLLTSSVSLIQIKYVVELNENSLWSPAVRVGWRPAFRPPPTTCSRAWRWPSWRISWRLPWLCSQHRSIATGCSFTPASSSMKVPNHHWLMISHLEHTVYWLNRCSDTDDGKIYRNLIYPDTKTSQSVWFLDMLWVISLHHQYQFNWASQCN